MRMSRCMGGSRRRGSFYNIGRQYYIRSPMLNLDRVLFSKVVVFTQSENGTLTTVELCTPSRWARASRRR